MWKKLPLSLNRAEENFFEDDTRLAQSYRDCEQAHLRRETKTVRYALLGEGLREFLAYHANLIAYAHLLFSDIHRDLADQNEIFILTDVNARLMEIHSHPQVLESVITQRGIRPGALLSEESCGTNAVALALRYKDKAIVRGEQHYCQLFKDWYSVAVPVFGVDGTVAGCVDISTSKDSPLGEKLALAKCLANELHGFFKGNVVHEHGKNDVNHDFNHKQLRQRPYQVELTERQQQVLFLFAQGVSYKQIARELGITSTKTVEQHLDAVRSKLGAKCRRECIQRATEIGLLHP